MSSGVEEIVVTAQRRDENLQKVPIAVQAFTSAQLVSRGITDTVALQQVTPGLIFGRGVGLGSTFLRGVGTGSSGASVENSVALYVDGVYYATKSNAISDLENVTRVEVLKGPQGTLFGRNASGGLVQVITADPTDTQELVVKVGYGNFKTVTASGHANVPISDTLAANFSAAYQNQGDGWGTNLATGKDVNVTDKFNTRAKILWQPTPSTKVTLAGDYAWVSTSVGLASRPVAGVKPQYGPIFTGGDWDIGANTEPSMVARSGGGSLKIEQDLPFGKLLSISAYRKSVYTDNFDNDYTPAAVVATLLQVHEEQYTQEFQLSGGQPSSLQWQTGAYFFWYNADQRLFNQGPGSGSGLQSTNRFGHAPIRSQAVYAQLTKELFPATRLTLGGRYTWEKRKVYGYSQTTNLAGVTTTTTPNPKRTSFEKPTWRIALEHDFSTDVLGYVSYNRGFKSGVLNPGVIAASPVKPEINDAYEGGLKTTLMDRKLRVNTAVFYYDFQDIQLSAFAVGQPQSLRNAARAEIYGVDIDFEFVPVPRLRLSGAAEWLHARYKLFRGAPGSQLIIPGGGASVTEVVASGNHMLRAPDFTGSFAVDYSVPVGDGSVNFNVNYAYTSRNYQEVSEVLSVDPISLINAQIAWKIDDNYKLTLWGRNLTNKFYYGQMNALNTAWQGSAAEPRTYGVRAEFNF